MDFTVTELDGETNLIALAGRLDSAGAEAIDLRFTAALGGAGKHAMVDLTQVEFVASLGLRLFISTARAMQRRGRKFVLFGADPAVTDVFETISLAELIPVAPDAAAAQALLAA